MKDTHETVRLELF